MILAGDVGGTKTLIEIGEFAGGRWLPAHSARYAAADHPDLDAMLRRFLLECEARSIPKGSVSGACLGVAGPVADNRAQLTNLPWVIDGAAIGAMLGIATARIVNDFAAAASGTLLLEPPDLAVLQPGEPLARAPRLVIGAGTGLGVAYMVWNGEEYQVVSGEGGHAGFSPSSLEQGELWRDLFARQGRVIAEDVVSGPGLTRIHDHILRSQGDTPASAAPADIVDGALVSGDRGCLRTLDLFIQCYGEVVRNHALAILPRGGVYVAGGIAPKILPRLRQGAFLAAFNAEGAHAATLRKIPVSIVTNQRLGLLGAALMAGHIDRHAETQRKEGR